jgi:hypothetical protein
VVDKKSVTAEVIEMLKPAIRKAIIQAPIEHRDDLEQELYLKIVKKISEENIEELPGFFEILEAKGKPRK